MSHTEAYRACFLVGPTAVGKSAVCHEVAARTGCSLISADSMLVYRGMDIGTAKPTAEERARLSYYGLDLVNPDQSFSAGEYRRHVLQALARLQPEGAGDLPAPAGVPSPHLPVVVGGTGLYVKVLTEGMVEFPPPAPGSRERWAARFEEGGVAALQQALRTTYPVMFDSLADPSNARRLLRALELAEAGVAAMPAGWTAGTAPRPVLTGLAMDPARLALRIESRVAQLYRGGFVEEVRGLRAACPEWAATALQAIGYAEVIALLDGLISREEAMSRTAARTRRLAKRQRSWFRSQADVLWIEVTESMAPGEVADRVMASWRENGPTRIPAR